MSNPPPDYQRSPNQRNSSEVGIALGPILFIIAILAVLAAVIAAGGSGFNASTNDESSKAMANVVLAACDDYQNALNKLVSTNECDISTIDWSPPSMPTGVTTWTGGDFTGGRGTNRSGSGKCALFDPRGGSMIFKQLPAAALASTITGAYTTTYSSNAAQVDALAGYLILNGLRCLYGHGTCSPAVASSNSNGAVVLSFHYLSYQVCKQINARVATGIDPNATFNTAYSQQLSFYTGTNIVTNGSTGGGQTVFSTASTYAHGCAKDIYSNGSNTAYLYSCPLMLR